jgi:hypothetical protein
MGELIIRAGRGLHVGVTCLLCLSIAIPLAIATPARAEAGDLTYKGCLRDDDYFGVLVCGPATTQGIYEPRAAATSRDGTSVYFGGDDLATFKRDPASGKLTFDGCFSARAVDNCRVISIGSTDDVRDVAVSDDGKSVYAIYGGALAFFRRGIDGRLAFDSCFSGSGNSVGCLPTKDFGFLQSLDVSHDGNTVLTTSLLGTTAKNFWGQLTVYRRDPAIGMLNYASCLYGGGGPQSQNLNSCVEHPSLNGPASVEISGDGKSVYVGSEPNLVTVFSRFAGSELGFVQCFAGEAPGYPSGPADGCTKLKGLGSPIVRVSGNGQNVYVAGSETDTVTVLVRDARTSVLRYTGCLRGNNQPGNGCTSVPGLNAPRDIALSTNGRSIYVTGSKDFTLDQFERSVGDGSFRFRRCYGNTKVASCAPAEGLRGAWSIAAPIDDNHVYVGSNGDHAVVSFSAEPEDAGRLGSVAPESLAFGNQQVGTTSTAKKVTIANVGTGDLVLDTFVIEGANAADFSRVNNCGGSGVVLGPAQSCSLDVLFRPRSTGAKAAVLLLADNGPGSPHEVTLTGTGTDASVVLTPETSIDAGPRPKTRKTSATFAFSSSAAGSTFECSLDGADFEACTAPHTVDGLARGSHIFRVRAVDADGTFDPTPAETVFKVKKRRG